MASFAEGKAGLDLPTELALERTYAANERTLMAWVRTATSLITFGFSVYKFFQLELSGPQRIAWVGPRGFGIALILIGLLSLVLAIVSHHRSEAYLRRRNPKLPRSLATVVSGLVAILGLFGLIMVTLRR